MRGRGARNWSNAGSTWDHTLIGYALDRFHRRYLRTPTLVELRGGIEDMPSYATIRRRYGSAGAMLRAHGYRVRDRGGQPGRAFLPARDATGRFVARPAQSG
jgi:hypothetical protein